MHELAITESILNQAIAEAKKQKATAIKVIKLKIGRGRAWSRTACSSISRLPGRGRWRQRQSSISRFVPMKLVCPKCRAEVKDLNPSCACQAGVEIVSGQELAMEDIDI